jgi:hypothetical protein
MPRLNPTFYKITVHRDEGDAGDTSPAKTALLHHHSPFDFAQGTALHPSSFILHPLLNSSPFAKALVLFLLLLNLLLPAAGFVHAIASDIHHTDIVTAETGDADDCEDTHHTDHATLITQSEYPVPTDSYHLVPAPLSDSHSHPVDVSLHLPQVVIPIFVPPQIVV